MNDVPGLPEEWALDSTNNCENLRPLPGEGAENPIVSRFKQLRAHSLASLGHHFYNDQRQMFVLGIKVLGLALRL